MDTQPPSSFVAALHSYDPLLRVRWAVRTNLWFIERKMPERHKQLLSERPNPYKSKRGKDLYDGWKAGYVHVLSVHPSLLDNRVFDTLRQCDIWAHGGVDRVNRALDDAILAERQSEDRVIQNFNESASREAHDQLQWGLGNRIAMPGLTLDTGLGFGVRDQRQHQPHVERRGSAVWVRG